MRAPEQHGAPSRADGILAPGGGAALRFGGLARCGPQRLTPGQLCDMLTFE